MAQDRSKPPVRFRWTPVAARMSDTRRGPAACERDSGECARSSDLPLGPRPGSLDRPCATTELQGSKERLGSITKAGHGYLRQMLIVGAMAVVRYAERNGTKQPWLVQLLARRKANPRAATNQQV